MIALVTKLVPFRDWLYGGLAVAAVIFWFHHDHVEQLKGAQAVQTAVAAANAKADAAAKANIAALTKQYQDQATQIQVSYEKQLADASAQHDSDVQRLQQLEANSRGAPHTDVGSAPALSTPTPSGPVSAPDVGSVPADLYVRADVALGLADALRLDDAQLQACWAERDTLTGK
jgi:hypothetical protein